MQRRVVGGVVVLAAIACAVTAALSPPLPLPVTIDLHGLGTDGLTGRTELATVAGRIAVLVPAALVGLGLLAGAPLLWIDLAAAPITVFLVAQLNGITDVGALVLTYASAAGAVLLRLIGSAAALRFAAMLGVVPWGVIALHQVGQIVAGSPPGAGVRVATLAVLAASIAEFAAGWRGAAAAWTLLAPLPAVLLMLLGVLLPLS